MTALRCTALLLLVCSPLVAQGGDRPRPHRSDALVKATGSATKPDAVGKQTITLQLTMKKGWYIYANPVDNDMFEACRTRVTVTDSKWKAVTSTVRYPRGEVHDFGDNFKLNIYKGTVEIEVLTQRSAHDNEPIEISIYVQAGSLIPLGKSELPGTIKLIVP